MHKYLEKKNEVHFDKIFNQVFGKRILLYTVNTRRFLFEIDTGQSRRISEIVYVRRIYVI